MFRSYDHHQAEKYFVILKYNLNPDPGRTTETCRYVCISNISSHDIKVS
jgi:hypothetical protein